MNNHYEALGVQRDAGPSIVKIAYEGKLKALAKAGLADAERQAEERLLERAYATLSDDIKRERYDQQLDQHLERQEEAARNAGGRGWIVAVVAVLIVAGSFGAYINNRNNARERIRLEEERIARDRDEAKRQVEAEEAQRVAEREAAQFRAEQQERNDARMRERRDSSSRYASDYDFRAQQDAHKRALDYAAEQREREEDAKQRGYARQAEDDRRRAQAEVERQKRFVSDREREEERIRAERAYRAQHEADLARAREIAVQREEEMARMRELAAKRGR
jgi:hypothetical protein